MPPGAILNLVRAVFATLCVLVGAALFASEGISKILMGGALGGAFAGLMILIDVVLKTFTIRSFSFGTFGLLIGILCAWAINHVPWPEGLGERKRVVELMLYGAFGYIGCILALRSNRQEFSLIIPYVRFRNEGVMQQPLLVDTNIIIDGRIPGICETGFLGGTLIIPRFVLDELHLLADSHDQIKRDRGRRGLDCLEALKRAPGLEVSIHDDYQSQEKLVDSKLVQLAKLLDARLLTNDANLGRVAQLQGVPLLNLNSLALAMRPVLNVGDEFDLPVVKEGREDHQAVGYLADGTMIVVNHARERIGTTVSVIVSSAMQTSAGRLIFAEMKPVRPAKSLTQKAAG